MTYARKLVYHYPNSKEFTLKLGYRLPLGSLQEDLPFLVTLNNAQSVEFHTDCGEIWYGDKICVTKVRCKKPPRTANPNSKTKMQKRAEELAKVDALVGRSIAEFITCSELRGEAFTNSLVAHINALKSAVASRFQFNKGRELKIDNFSEQPNYHFWLGENT